MSIAVGNSPRPLLESRTAAELAMQPESGPPAATLPVVDRFGICQWFHHEDYRAVERSVGLLHDLGIRHLRTGISWADYFRPAGKQWYDFQMKALAEFDVLLSVWHTPPSISEGNACASPPRRLRDFADFIDRIIGEHGDRFSHLELWNEPNNRLKWNFVSYDPQWRKFAEMVGAAAYWAKARGVATVLGGMVPVDHHWLSLMQDYGVLQYIDKVGIHAFPGMWWPGAPNWDWCRDWHGWSAKIDYIRGYSQGRPIWVTETGLATWDLARECEGKLDLQTRLLADAVAAPAERVYWYSLMDLDPAREAIEGFHVDENEYHLGLVRHDGSRKTAYDWLKSSLAAGRAQSTPDRER